MCGGGGEMGRLVRSCSDIWQGVGVAWEEGAWPVDSAVAKAKSSPAKPIEASAALMQKFKCCK